MDLKQYSCGEYAKFIGKPRAMIMKYAKLQRLDVLPAVIKVDLTGKYPVLIIDGELMYPARKLSAIGKTMKQITAELGTVNDDPVEMAIATLIRVVHSLHNSDFKGTQRSAKRTLEHYQREKWLKMNPNSYSKTMKKIEDAKTN